MNYFNSSDLPSDLGRTAVRAGAVSSAGNAAQFIVMAAGTVVLARLLTPEDYGLVAMATAFTSVIAGFKDFGLAASTVQQPVINHQQTSTLFWVNVAFGALLAVIVSAASPMVAALYGEPRVAAITLAIASTFIISGLATQHHSLLRRQLRFGDVAAIELVATVLGVAIAIVMAFYGATYWSLVLMYVLTQFFTTIGVWLRCEWRPGRPSPATGVRSMLTYGGYLTGFNIVNSVLRSFDRMLIGRTASAGPLGLYSRAAFLVFIPVERLSSASTGVAIPVLSRLQDDPDRYRSFLLMATLLFGTVATPFGCFAFGAADTIVLAILGDKWLGAVPILRALAPIGVFATFEAAAIWVCASTGHTRRQFIVGVVLTIGAGIAMLIGARWGVIGVAVGLSAAYSVLWTAGLTYCLRTSPVRIADVAGVLWRPVLTAALAAAIVASLDRVAPAGGALAVFARDAVAFIVIYLGGWVLLPGGLTMLREMAALSRALRA